MSAGQKTQDHGIFHGIGGHDDSDSFLCIRENAFRQLMVSQAIYPDRLRIIAWIGGGYDGHWPAAAFQVAG